MSKLVGKEASTLGSLVYFIKDFATGKIKQDQFWEVHKYLDKGNGFDEIPQDNLGDFGRLYRGNYRTEQVDRHTRKNLDDIDRWLKKLKESAVKIGRLHGEFRSDVKDILKLYNYSDATKQISSKTVTVAELRDKVRILLH